MNYAESEIKWAMITAIINCQINTKINIISSRNKIIFNIFYKLFYYK